MLKVRALLTAIKCLEYERGEFFVKSSKLKMTVSTTLLQDDETVSEEEKVDVMRLMSVNQFPSSVGTVEIVSGRGQLLHLVGFCDQCCLCYT